MAFQTPITIKEVIGNIDDRRYTLPAIQRELVWRPYQIERLFDSLMRGYPIGSFLFWRVKPESARKYKFYDFVLNYHERDARHNQPRPVTHTESDLIAVLDGQQRLTALNIGLRGSYASKLPRLWWNNPNAYPKLRLYLNLLANQQENEDGIRYEFKFMNDRDAKERNEKTYWYRVGDIHKVDGAADLFRFVLDAGLSDREAPFNILTELHDVVHKERVISFYEEQEQDIDKVLNIFVRTNSGGTQLSYSDILMSIATAQWDKINAREEIHGLVDGINQIGHGFSFDKDFVLKAGLMLSDINNIGFKATNFNTANMNKIQDEWGGIKASVYRAIELVAGFGYSSITLASSNVVLPIAYYIHHNRFGSELFKNANNLEVIKHWLIRSLIKRGVWGGATDSLFVAIRSAIKESVGNDFPSDSIESVMRRFGRGLAFDDEELEDLLDVQYSDRRAYGLLTLLYPFIDVKTNQFHVDHVFPRAQMTASKLRGAGVAEDDIQTFLDRVNRIANLQLLPGIVNQEKSAKLPSEWLCVEYPDQRSAKEHVSLHNLGDLPEDITGFNDFYEARRERMLARLRGILGVRSGVVSEPEEG